MLDTSEPSGMTASTRDRTMNTMKMTTHIPGERLKISQASPNHATPRLAGTFCPSGMSSPAALDAASRTDAFGGANGLSRSWGVDMEPPSDGLRNSGARPSLAWAQVLALHMLVHVHHAPALVHRHLHVH